MCLCFLVLSEIGSEEGQRAATQSVLVRFPTPLCNPGSFNEMGGLAWPASAVLKPQREPSLQEGHSVLQPLCGRDPTRLAKGPRETVCQASVALGHHALMAVACWASSLRRQLAPDGASARRGCRWSRVEEGCVLHTLSQTLWRGGRV